jgi:hypothetical protein
MHFTFWHEHCTSLRSTTQGERIMDLGLDPALVCRQHDLRVELGLIEMAMERLDARNEQEHGNLLARLETRLSHLRDAIRQLPA